MPRPKSPPRQAYEEFVFHVRRPSVDYSFGLQHDAKLRAYEPFDRSQTVTFVVEGVWPDRIKGQQGLARLWPEDGYAEGARLPADSYLRRAVGHIKATKSTLEVWFSLPAEDCWRLAQGMATGLVTSMLSNGLVEPRGINRPIRVSFHGPEFDPVAYVG
jgi:hypothetical protein